FLSATSCPNTMTIDLDAVDIRTHVSPMVQGRDFATRVVNIERQMAAENRQNGLVMNPRIPDRDGEVDGRPYEANADDPSIRCQRGEMRRGRLNDPQPPALEVRCQRDDRSDKCADRTEDAGDLLDDGPHTLPIRSQVLAS